MKRIILILPILFTLLLLFCNKETKGLETEETIIALTNNASESLTIKTVSLAGNEFSDLNITRGKTQLLYIREELPVPYDDVNINIDYSYGTNFRASFTVDLNKGWRTDFIFEHCANSLPNNRGVCLN
ncbi:MAG: hypothetical protein CMC19_09760 [Flavobacteriaceae bacterium]|nr:hypothetical protein [Flavobacteriaceae bacterium]OUX39176.1 MAG: hypothetical protein CBE25_05035 [Flavobacteriaceae bacterium TMED265]